MTPQSGLERARSSLPPRDPDDPGGGMNLRTPVREGGQLYPTEYSSSKEGQKSNYS